MRRDEHDRITQIDIDGPFACAICGKHMPEYWEAVCWFCGKILCYDHSSVINDDERSCSEHEVGNFRLVETIGENCFIFEME